MATELKLPEVGDNIEQGTVVSVLVRPGDTVTEGQALIEIETDKAVVEVPATAAGTVGEVKVKEGDSVLVGGVIVTLTDGGGESAAPASSSAPPAAQQREAPKPAVPQATPSAPASSAPASQPAASGGQVTLPEVGDNVTQGVVVSVLVKAGDSITAGQAVIEIETDKAVVEVPANAAGTVAEVKVKEGDTVPVGGVILTLSGAGGAAAPAAQTTTQTPGLQDTQGADERAMTVESSATPAEPEAARQAAQAQQEAQKQQAQSEPVKTSQPPPQGAPQGQAAAPQASGTQNTQTFDGREVIAAAPSIRRLAREMSVDIHMVHGTGIAGRISEEDVRRTAGTPSVQPAASSQQPVASGQPAPVSQAAPLPDFSRWGSVRAEDMSGIRRATVRSMTQAWTTIPMVTHFDKADVTRMEAVRKEFGARVEKAGGKLTMTSILMKVVANALRRFPKFGASIDTAKNQVIFKDYVNLGIAVDTPNGLLVPVLRDADRKSITELSVEIGEIAVRARDRKLKPDEMQGATFTISNLGGIGGHAFTPIVNPPEVAILGVSRGGFEPVWNRETESFEPRNMLPLTLSYDHRLIDGADAARFMRFICESLEDPFLISL